MQKITPFLWFNDNALEAAEFYSSIFKHTAVTDVTRMGDSGPVISVSFTLEGQAFLALNGGPHFSFTPAISLFVDCETQAEVDDLWGRLSAGGEKSRCGWLKDKFGLSWQIIPNQLGQLMRDPDPVKAKRVMDAMMQMNKIVIADLQNAYMDN
jgi:predicted 3-demethylubiquinone-9 3-methyltransferase (glyoxalase superfamily)